jgi:hypothetical protein
MAIEQAARELLQAAAPGEELDAARQMLAALLGIGTEDDFDIEMLNALTPEVVLRLDMLIENLLQLSRRKEAVQALRALVIHGVK